MKISKISILFFYLAFFYKVDAQVVDTCVSKISSSAHGHLFALNNCPSKTLTIQPSGNHMIIDGSFNRHKRVIIKPRKTRRVRIVSSNHVEPDTKHKKTHIKIPPASYKTASSFNKFKESKELVIFPNPATDNLKISSYKKITSTYIYNLQGVLLLENINETKSKYINLNLERIKSGTYLVKVIFEDNTSMNKTIFKN